MVREPLLVPSELKAIIEVMEKHSPHERTIIAELERALSVQENWLRKKEAN